MPVQLRQREYETIYIMRTDVKDEDVTKVRDRVEGVLEKSGGHMLKFDDWGQRKLSYQIRDAADGKRFDYGRYHYYRYLAPSNGVAELERNLNLLGGVLKFLTIKLDDDLIPEERLARPVEEEIEEIIPVMDEEE